MAGYKCKHQQRLGFLCKPEMAEAIETFAKEHNQALTEVIRDAVTYYLAYNEQIQDIEYLK